MRKFQDISKGLKKQVYVRSVMATIFLLSFVVSLICMHDIVFALPCIAVFIFLYINVGVLLYDCLTDKYVEIRGECIEVEVTPVRKRVKCVCIIAESGSFKISIHHRIGRVQIGDELVAYVSARTALYEQNGWYIVSGYYAMEVNGK